MKKMNIRGLSLLIHLLYFAQTIKTERLHEKIYSSIEGAAPCFRRLNGTHQAGCSSSEKGAVGVVQMINDLSDVQWVVYNATAGPYVAVIDTFLFHDVVELLMTNPAQVAGVLLYENATMRPSAFSQESRCPNEYSSGPGSQCSSTQAGGIVWNEQGTGLLRRDIPFPVFYLPESRAEEITKIQKCYESYNLDKLNQEGKPLCSVQLNSFMFAAVNSAVCLRRSAASALLTQSKVCDPLGDNNVYYSLFPRVKETAANKKSVILVTARIDTATLFDGLSPGAASSVVGLVTLLTAATALSNMISVNDSNLYDKNVMWTLFNGEAFDYIGSQRVAYDMRQGAWPAAAPLDPARVALHVELGQLGAALPAALPAELPAEQPAAPGAWPLVAFAPYDVIPPEADSFLKDLQKYAAENNLTVTEERNINLPPSSLHSFRRTFPNETASGELPQLLLVDHKETFSNKFYHSVLDDYDKIGFVYHNISIGSDGTFVPTAALLANGTLTARAVQVQVSRLGAALARALFGRVTGRPYVGDYEPSAHMVDEMLYCLTRSQACRMLLAADYAATGSTGSGDAALPARPAPLYAGVAAWAGTAAVFAGHMLALLTGTHLPHLDKPACDAMSDPDFSYYYLRGWNDSGVCIQTTMNFSAAVSPAFVISDYDMSSGEYSTWTESVWQAMWARVFVSAGGGGARAALGAGLASTLLAAALTYWLRRHADVVFVHSPHSPHSARGSLGDATSGILRTVNC